MFLATVNHRRSNTAVQKHVREEMVGCFPPEIGTVRDALDSEDA